MDMVIRSTSFNIVVAGFSIQSMRPMTAEAPSSTTPDVSPSSVYLSQIVSASIPTPPISSSLPTPLNDFTHGVFSFTPDTYVPVNEQAATPLVVSGPQPYTSPTQETKSETGGTESPHPSLIATGASKVHHNTDRTSAIMTGPVSTYYTLQTVSTTFERLSQLPQLSQSLSLWASPSSLILGDAVPNTNTVSRVAVDSQSIIQLLHADGSASFSWQHTEFIPYEEHQRTSMPESNQVVTTQGVPYGSRGGVTMTGTTTAQGINMLITLSKENSDSSLPSDHRSILHMPTTCTICSTEYLSIDLGAHSLSAAELSQPFLIQGPRDGGQPSSTEHVDRGKTGQYGAKSFVNLSSIESGLVSLQMTSPADNAYLFLQDGVVASKSTAIVVGTLAAEYSISITTDADTAVQTDPFFRGLQRLTNALIQQPNLSAATPTYRSYSESRNPSASDQRDGRISGRAISVMVGAVAGRACGFLGIFAIAVRHRKRKRHRIWISNQYWNDPNRSYISFGSM
ncbi:hypothetical protein BDV29DRAFT_188661 [Aspergillus leporis]|uniref:Uncharacterized protein n=1 Tax=Aspergillus leporis TaxID=41062 RepID=A0A5N5XDN0_9EURO|nr:hypothetical protein BDV29DRAFT_188661 [Aspergillus leporis]